MKKGTSQVVVFDERENDLVIQDNGFESGFIKFKKFLIESKKLKGRKESGYFS